MSDDAIFDIPKTKTGVKIDRIDGDKIGKIAVIKKKKRLRHSKPY